MPFLIVAILVTYFYEIFFLGESFIFGDNILAIVPHKIFVLENLKKGILPLWNPHVWAGFPEVSDVTFGLFNPFSIFHFLFPDINGINIIILISYFFALTGMYLLLRKEKLNQTSSLIGAIIFTFSGSMLNIASDMIRLETICFLPWILIFIKKQNYLASTLLLTLSFWIGQAQFYYMMIIFLFGYSFYFYVICKDAGSLILCFFCVLSSLLLSAFMWLPQLELINLSPRITSGQTYNTIWSLHPFSLIRFLFADFWGRYNEGSFWGPGAAKHNFGYVGFLTLIVIFTNLKKINSKNIYFVIMAFVTLLISLGKYFPFYKIFLLIPGFTLFRNPSAWLVIYSFSIASLAAFIVDKIDFRAASSSMFKKAVAMTSIWLIFFGIILILLAFPGSQIPNLIFKFTYSLFHKNMSVFHSAEADRGIFFLLGRNFLILGILSLLLWWKFRARVLLIVIFLDLFFLARGDIVLGKIDKNFFHKLSQVSHIKFLINNLKENRFVSTSEFIPYRGLSIYMDSYTKRPPFVREDGWPLTREELTSFKEYYRQLELLPPNVYLSTQLSSVNGYSGFYLKNFGEYFAKPSDYLDDPTKDVIKIRAQNQDPLDPSHVNFNLIKLDDPRLSNLSTKYILSNEKLYLNQFHNNKEIKFPDGFLIYENPNYLPRAAIYNQKNELISKARIIDINPNEIKIILPKQAKDTDYLLLRDTYYPGWQAYDQNMKELIISAQEIFRRVNLNQNIDSVVFKFKPKSFYLGLIISGSTLITIIAFYLLINALKRKGGNLLSD